MKSSPANRLLSRFTNLSLIIMFFVLGNSNLLSQTQPQTLTSHLKIIDVYTKETNR